MTKFIYAFFMLFLLVSASAFSQVKPQLPVMASASKAKTDRLLILENELKEAVETLAKVTEQDPRNETKLNRIKEDIRLLNLEIDRVKKEKIVEVEWKQKEVKTVSNVSQETGEKTQEPNIKFESWDVFKNFGKKEN
jgi:septal ring factor EnvC (AmiA/AmiB activator)